MVSSDIHIALSLLLASSSQIFFQNISDFCWVGHAAQHLIAIPLHGVYFGGICGEELVNGTNFILTMKYAWINPVHKSGSFNSAEKYRPISILPIFCKFFEKLINKQIINYLETDK